jgi:hypothetical protein
MGIQCAQLSRFTLRAQGLLGFVRERTYVDQRKQCCWEKFEMSVALNSFYLLFALAVAAASVRADYALSTLSQTPNGFVRSESKTYHMMRN